MMYGSPREPSNLPLNAALPHTVVTMVDGGRIPDSGEINRQYSTADTFRWRTTVPIGTLQDRKGVRGSDKGTPGNR
jgi:hypothetical protein